MEDFDVLLELLKGYGQIVTTPHVLTEVSNLAGMHGEPERSALFVLFARLVKQLPELHEETKTIAEEPTFVRLGLTDAALQRVAKANGLHVVTTDLTLWEHLFRIGVHATNFNHLRGADA